LAILTGTVALGGLTLTGEAHRRDTSQMEGAFAAVDAAVAGGADPTELAAAIDRADAALASIGAAQDLAPDWVERAAVLESARDAAWAIERLGEPTRIGLLPEPLRDAETRLVAVDERAFLVGAGFYEIDVATGRLVEVLAPGAMVDGHAIGSIVDASADAQGLVVDDGSAFYRQGADGRWTATARFERSGAGWPRRGRTATFNGRLYALEEDGRIVRYEDQGGGFAPTSWASPVDYPDLADANDIAVDGRVHLLLADGRVISMYEGMLDAAEVVPVSPPLGGDGFFGEANATKALYVVEPGFQAGRVRGRLVRFDAGGATQQFVAPAPSSADRKDLAAAEALGEARSGVVIEGNRTFVFLSGDELWQATLPPLIGL
jgi:hypothetical protein